MSYDITQACRNQFASGFIQNQGCASVLLPYLFGQAVIKVGLRP